MNPARSTGPALWNNDFDKFWIYWAAPVSAGLITAIIYRYVFYAEIELETDTEVIRAKGTSKCSNKTCQNV